MPIVLRVGGFAFAIYLRDHAPPHVHVRYSGRWCKVELETLKLTASNMNRSEEGEALRLVSAHADVLFVLWVKLHPEESR